MFTVRNDFARITQFVRKLRGGSEPILVQADDDLLYVVKFINNLQGPNVLFNEGAGTELYRACGLSTPRWKPLLLTNSFLDQNRGSWMETDKGALRPEAGLCFGSLYLGAGGRKLFEILPGSSLSRIDNRASFWLAWLVDACGNHVDNRQAIFAEDTGGKLNAFFVDHGHLFGGPNGVRRMPFVGSRYLDPRIYPDLERKEVQALLKVVRSLDTEQLSRRVQALPEDWKTASALNGFVQCLHGLSDSNRVRNILDAMINGVRAANWSQDRSVRFGPVSEPNQLYPALQGAAPEYSSIAY
jgi:hypothetical protein